MNEPNKRASNVIQFPRGREDEELDECKARHPSTPPEARVYVMEHYR